MNTVNQSNVSIELLQQFMDNESIIKDMSQYSESVEVLNPERHLQRISNATRMKLMEQRRT